MGDGSAIVDTSLKVNSTKRKLTRMRVYHFRFYWISNLVVVVTLATFEEDRLKTAVAIVDDRYFGETQRQTDIHSSDLMYLFNAVHCTGHTFIIIIVIINDY